MGDHSVSTLQTLYEQTWDRVWPFFIKSTRPSCSFCWTPFSSFLFLLLVPQFPPVPQQCDTYTPPHSLKQFPLKISIALTFLEFFYVRERPIGAFYYCPSVHNNFFFSSAERIFLHLRKEYFPSPNISLLL